MSKTATNSQLSTATLSSAIVLACANTGMPYEVVGQMYDRETYVASVVAERQTSPVDDLYSRSFLTQRDADELRALNKQQSPTTRGKLLRTRP